MIAQLIADKLKVAVFENRQVMGAAAADRIAERINELLNQQEWVNMIFAAAPSQNEMLAALVQKEIDWSRIHAFHMDEYIGLPEDAPQGFGNFLKERIFGRLPFKSVNYLRGNASDMDAEINRYEALLHQHPTDITCMGIGENGHLAFNDPPVADFNDLRLVKKVVLDEVCRQQQVNDGCFENINAVPTEALTLTIPALMRSAHVFCVVPGPTKSQAIFNTIHQQIVEMYPSTILRRHQDATLFLDDRSAALLK